MTPRKKALINVGAIIGALLTVGGWAVRSSAMVVDARYVHADTFALKSIRDSLNYRNDVREIRAMLTHLESDLHVARSNGRRSSKP